MNNDTRSRIRMAKKRMLDLMPIWRDSERNRAEIEGSIIVLSLVWTVLIYDAKGLVRVAMYFRSYFLESCKYIHFWKAQTFLKPKTNVSI